MSAQKSYFDEDTLDALIERHEAREDTPAWLIAALEALADHAEAFGVEDDGDDNVEFIYPH